MALRRQHNMKCTKLTISLIIFLSVSNIRFGVGQSITINPHTEIEDVISKFKYAILNKDSTVFYSLFFSPSISFVGVMSKKTEESIQKKYPEFEGTSVSNCRKFMLEICKSPKQHDEKFINIKINTIGIIATVSFDYSYHIDDKMIQWGQESWNLVFVENNWLITDVIYSVHFPNIEPCPFFP